MTWEDQSDLDRITQQTVPHLRAKLMMAKKNRKAPPNLQIWIDARKRHHLSHAQIQMARELGMNPRKLGGIDNHRQELWKRPLPQFIEELYFKRFGRSQPELVVPIEQRVKDIKGKKEEKNERKRLKRLEKPLDPVQPDVQMSDEQDNREGGQETQ